MSSKLGIAGAPAAKYKTIMRSAALTFLILALTATISSASPDNDQFAARTLLEGDELIFTAHQLHAQVESEEPNHASAPYESYQTVWWTWTAPADGLVLVDSPGGVPGWFYLTIYSGTTLQSLIQCAAGQPTNIPRTWFTATKGTSYQIVGYVMASEEPIESFFGGSTSRMRLYAAKPGNDDFRNRIKVASENLLMQGHTVGATREIGEPPHADFPLPNSVWWQWTPPFSGIVSLHQASSYPGRVRVYIGDALASLLPVETPPTFDLFKAEAGQTYQIAVGPYAEDLQGEVNLKAVLSRMFVSSPEPHSVINDLGPIELTLTNLPEHLQSVVMVVAGVFPLEYTHRDEKVIWKNPVPGKHQISLVAIDADGALYHAPVLPITVLSGSDTFAAAPLLDDQALTVGGDFDSATAEPAEPGGPTVRSIWWKWTAQDTGHFSFLNASFAKRVYEGSALETLSPVPFINASQTPLGDNLTFRAEKARTYYFQLWQSSVGEGWGSTPFRFAPDVPGDAFAESVIVTTNQLEMMLPVGFTSCEAGEPGPCSGNSGSRWLSFTPQVDGTLRASLESWLSVQDRTSVAVFTGDTLSSLSPVTGSGAEIEAQLRGSQTYHIRIQTPTDVSTNLASVLKLIFLARPTNDHLKDALMLDGESGSTIGSTDLATTESWEQSIHGGGGSIWFRFVPAKAGALAVRLLDRDQLGFYKRTPAGEAEYAPKQWPGGSRAAIELAAGEEILLRVVSAFAAREPSSFTLEHLFVPRPRNDDFSDRFLLQGRSATAMVNIWSATREPAEPQYANDGFGRTAWWEWVAPDSGSFKVTAPPGYHCELFTTNLLGHVAPVYIPRPPGEDLFNQTIFSVTKNQLYFIRIKDALSHGMLAEPFTSNMVEGIDISFQLTTLALTSPTNSTRVEAEQQVIFTAAPPHPEFDGEVASVVYLLRTNSPTTDAVLLGAGTGPSSLFVTDKLFPAVHDVQAVATNKDGRALFSNPLRLLVAPRNDQFTNAFVLGGDDLEVRSVISGSSLEPSEPLSLPGFGSVWYRWTPSATGLTWVSSEDLWLNVYTGGHVAQLTPVASGLPISFVASSGSNYWVRATGPTDKVGSLVAGAFRLQQSTTLIEVPGHNSVYKEGDDINVRITSQTERGALAAIELFLGANLLSRLHPDSPEFRMSNAVPGIFHLIARPVFTNGLSGVPITNSVVVRSSNDAFTNRLAISFERGTVYGNTASATPESGSPNVAGDLWYTWTAPARGMLFVEPKDGRSISTVALYTGTSLTNLVLQANRRGNNINSGEWLVTAGITYLFSVQRTRPELIGGEFELDWDFRPAVSNDSFDQRIVLLGHSGEVPGSTILASLEPNEPSSDLDPFPVASVWWRWTPPADGILEISYPLNNAQPHTVRPWIGNELAALRPAPPFGDLVFHPDTTRYYIVQEGAELSLSLSHPSASVRSIPWSYRLLQPPSNDAFTNRVELHGTRVITYGSTLVATKEAFEPNLNTAASVWYSWKAPPEPGYLSLTLGTPGAVGGPFKLLIYSMTASGELSLDQFTEQGLTAKLVTKPHALYLLCVTSDRISEGAFGLSVQFEAAPNNDLFAHRLRLHELNTSFRVQKRFATREFLEPFHAGEYGGRSMWHTFIAPSRGVMEVSSPNEYIILAAYEGTNLTQLTPVAAQAAYTGGASLEFSVEASREYALVVDGMLGSMAEADVSVRFNAEAELPILRLVPREIGGFQLSSEGAGDGWILESSLDLETWEEIAAVPPTGTLTFDVDASTGERLTFYRLRQRL